ncbi:MAG: Rieske 2Fe-2S domain-containing protein [Gammaproteobacteria bacterium]|nr:Rieske 2Fe-2S domain-containing protein [Gammaproteobacteria bacterium]
MNFPLCSIHDIPDPGSKSFHVTIDEKPVDIFVVRKDSACYGFINSCPHTGVNLEWHEDQFLDSEQQFIQCTSHGALFEIDTGHCIHGPCLGDHLSAINIKVIADMIIFQG